MGKEPVSEERNLSAEDELPAVYGENRIVLMPVAPDQVHIYWEIDGATLERGRSSISVHDRHRLRVILRFRHAAESPLEEGASPGFLDVAVTPEAQKYYVSLAEPVPALFVELGLQTEDGRFFPLVRSNRITTPPFHPAAKEDKPRPTPAETERLLQPPTGVTAEEPCEVPAHKPPAGFPVPEQIVRQRIAEFYALFYAPHPAHPAQAAESPASSARHPLRTVLDLTELSEQRFALSISSSMGASSA